ncbi:MAG TPA: Uma2 family endonuclease [Chthonomonadaceae bacterium]|nr:Uma2 family endonuclease [Chthonomonadaceae bacterium]
MATWSRTRRITATQYLERERIAETKSEFDDGEIVAMAGASPNHNRAAGNIFAGLHLQLRTSACEPFDSDMRVHVPACDHYYYPDASVACGEASFENVDGVESLQNPVLIVEVLSKSTEARDRGEKLICYQTLPSLQVYLLVSSDRPLVQIYERQADDSWRYTVFLDVDHTIELACIGCRLALADVYARVEFPSPPEGACSVSG